MLHIFILTANSEAELPPSQTFPHIAFHGIKPLHNSPSNFYYIPGDFCRQTDILRSALATYPHSTILLEKGAFLSSSEYAQALEKLKAFQATSVLAVEAGVAFGYSGRTLDLMGLTQLQRLDASLDITLNLWELCGGGGDALTGALWPFAYQATEAQERNQNLENLFLAARKLGIRHFVIHAFQLTPFFEILQKHNVLTPSFSLPENFLEQLLPSPNSTSEHAFQLFPDATSLFTQPAKPPCPQSLPPLSFVKPHHRLLLIAGPCMLESLELASEVADFLVKRSSHLPISLVFKGSFDKANRTSIKSERGPGLERGLKILADISQKYNIPVITDIHEPEQAAPVASVCAMLQIPAFLAAHTPLLQAAGQTGAFVHLKQGQHMSPLRLIHSANIIRQSGSAGVILCNRGSLFGYGNLTLDFRSLFTWMQAGYFASCDITHAAQLPGACKNATGGLRAIISTYAHAALAAGVRTLFMEVHPRPSQALSDKETQLSFNEFELLLNSLEPYISLQP